MAPMLLPETLATRLVVDRASRHYDPRHAWQAGVMGGLCGKQEFVIRTRENVGNNETSYQLLCTRRTQFMAHCEGSIIESDSSNGAPVEYHGEAGVDYRSN